jgi:hypothetical protein
MIIKRVSNCYYEFFITDTNKKIKVASLSKALIYDIAYLDIYLPQIGEKQCSIKFNLNNLHWYDCVEKAKHIVQKKLYKYAQNIFDNLNQTSIIDERKYK